LDSVSHLADCCCPNLWLVAEDISTLTSTFDGGPLTGRKAVVVQRTNLNRKLAPLRLSFGSGLLPMIGSLPAIQHGLKV
jgi:hypothetical protein